MMGVKTVLTISLVIVLSPCAVLPSNAIKLASIDNATIFSPNVSLAVPYYSLIKDNKDGTLYLGSSGYIYKVNSSNFKEIWSQNITKKVEDQVISCERTTPVDKRVFWCENQISVIEEIEGENELLVCGTNSGQPRCWNCSMIDGFDNAPTSCNIYTEGRIDRYLPSRPDFDYTWFYDQNTSLVYVGTEREASRESYFAKVAFDEFFTLSPASLLTNNPSNENWLNMPAFVGKPVRRGEYIYFFFRETATEYKNAGKIIYSRVGRICANNDATRHTSLRNYYQTLVKARLNCSIDLEFPFYFNEIQDVYMPEKEEVIYAVFTTPSEGPPASAVCAFSWLQIDDLFNKKAGYKGQEETDSDWLRKSQEKLNLGARPGTCGYRFGSTDELTAVNNYNLIDELVPSIRNVLSPSANSDDSSKSPLLYYNGYRFNSIVKVEEGVTSDKIILMIGTTDMKMLKAYFSPSMGSEEYGSIVSEIDLGSGDYEVRDIVPYTKGSETYVIATAVEKAVKIPVVYCEIYTTCEECKHAKDPDCVWRSRTCTKKSNQNEQHDRCYITSQSKKIDIVQAFGSKQHVSKHRGHNVNFYALAIARKGCNFMSEIREGETKYWNISIDEGTATDAEFYAIRFTGSEENKEKLRNVLINLYCRNDEVNSVNMTVEVIQDISEVADCAEKIYEYDCELARYEYELATIRQEILRKCHGSPNKQEIYQCPSFTFQDLWR